MTTLIFSAMSRVLPLRRMPAVSMKIYSVPWCITAWSTESRVVPATGETMARSSPVSALSRVDLPTFGRPMMATLIPAGAGGAVGSSAGASPRANPWVTRSSRASTPMPCSDDTGNTSAMPSPKNSLVRPSRSCESILLTASETGLPRRLSIRARSRSLPVISARPSTRKMMWSAVFKTNSAWRRICPGMYSWSCTTMPPVSISSKRRPSSTGKGILWAVLDSGIDGSHPHFDKHGNLRDLPAPLTHMDFMADPPARLALPADDYGHGTHVAGIIAGELEASSPTPPVAIVRERDQNGKIAYTADHTLGSVVAIAPECKLVSFKVLDQNGQGPISNVIAALDMIQEINGFGRQIVIHGVNLSVGYDFDAEWFACGQSPVCVEVNRLVKSGVCVVIAAGNTGLHQPVHLNANGT